MMRPAISLGVTTAALMIALASTANAQSWSDQPVDVTAEHIEVPVAYEEDGRYYTDDGIPTFNIKDDGTVDWSTFSGFRRYHSECHVCHGPDGEGSTYAPKLKNSAVNMTYNDFLYTVAAGRQNGNSVMPHFGDNLNVSCFADDIYVYLKARGMDAIPRGRPALKDAKSDQIAEDENACMGQ